MELFSKIKSRRKEIKVRLWVVPYGSKTPMDSITYPRGFVMFIASGRRNRSHS
nr:MAG TPA: hypothetical protein [Caudoviricetes sp.]